MKQMNQKLATENAIITQAGKGKTIVIMNSEEYSNKIRFFLTTKNFRTLPRDPTDRYQKHNARMQLDYKQTTDKILNTKETLNTHTQSTI